MGAQMQDEKPFINKSESQSGDETSKTDQLSLKRRLYRKICTLGQKILPDRLYLKLLYEARMGKKLDLKNPRTFDEKMQWLKLYDRNPVYTVMADKYEVRKLVEEKLGKEYLIPLLGVWDRAGEIDFSGLPRQFVLKCTHDSGSVMICTDKGEFDEEAAREKLSKILKINYYYPSREWPYKNIRPRIIAEKYMTDESRVELKDYKIYTFGGRPYLVQVDFNRFTGHKRNLYTTEWEYIDETIEYPRDASIQIERPEKLEEMLECSRKLSQGTASLRTDFYSIGDKIYFGEITFYQEAGFAHFSSEEYAERLGSLIKLPVREE